MKYGAAVRWLVVRAIVDPGSVEAEAADALVAALNAGGHDVDEIDLAGDAITICMTADEHRAYESVGADHPDPVTAAHISLLQAADGIAFAFPTMWMAPAALKGWLERVMLPDIAFRLDEKSRVLKPGLTNVRHLAVVTTTDHPKKHRLAYGDPARRLVMRSIRSLCNRRCKTTWLAMHDRSRASDTEAASFVARVSSTFEAL